ncbi:unnamed protein product, partial [Laminaria digitata]
LRGFSWKHGINHFALPLSSTRHQLSTLAARIYLSSQPTALNADNHRRAGLAFSGPTHPAPISVAQETLIFRRGGFSPPLSLLMSAFALLIPPANLTIHLQRLTERS